MELGLKDWEAVEWGDSGRSRIPGRGTPMCKDAEGQIEFICVTDSTHAM